MAYLLDRKHLWRAVDQSGEVLDVLVQEHRDAKSAKRFFRKLLKVRSACIGISRLNFILPSTVAHARTSSDRPGDLRTLNGTDAERVLGPGERWAIR